MGWTREFRLLLGLIYQQVHKRTLSQIEFLFIQQIFIQHGWNQALRHRGGFELGLPSGALGVMGQQPRRQVMVIQCDEGQY